MNANTYAFNAKQPLINRVSARSDADSNKAPSSVLRTLFLHHDGIVLGATIAALNSVGLLDHLLTRKRVSFGELTERFPCNTGYLHVALRCLALAGWLEREGAPGSDSMLFAFTSSGHEAAKAFSRYQEVAAFVYSGISMERYLFENGGDRPRIGFDCYACLVERCCEGWGLEGHPAESDSTAILEIVHRHLEGMLTAPLMLALERSGVLHAGGVDLSAGINAEVMSAMRALLRHLGWMAEGEPGCFTPLGTTARDYVLHYGLTWSYYPLLCNLPRLLFQPARNVTHVTPGTIESHVDRSLNVLASGVAHRPYFEDADKLIIDIFNREPVSAQPKFVADMGCGDGAWLIRIYEVVARHTQRGRHLKDYPLLMIGADYNVEAQGVARHRLERADVPAIVLFGDISNPARLEKDLREHQIDIRDGLHIRAFIDHNRPYKPPLDLLRAEQRASTSTGSFADERGEVVPNHYIEQTLFENLRRWVPYVKKHGLIILEAHNVEPRIAARHIGRTHAIAFDTYHGYSNQYPLDFEAFMRVADEAGLRPVSYQQKAYPTRLPFVAISLNRFFAQDAVPVLFNGLEIRRDGGNWQPTGREDLVDGEALHRLLYTDGDINRPRQWCVRSAGVLIAHALKAIEDRIEALSDKPAMERDIRVVDYGTGTGFSTIELIKALIDKGLIERCSQLGIDFRMHLMDLPSGWFARCYSLLKSIPFVDFYSLRDPVSGQISDLDAVLGHTRVDLIIASMVLHLVPPKALPALISGFARTLRPGGTLLWSSPDTVPPLAGAEVIHATNRALRRAIATLIDEPERLSLFLDKVPVHARNCWEALIAALTGVRLTQEKRRELRIKAEKQILREPTDIAVIAGVLDRYFDSEIVNHLSVMSAGDATELALLPANRRYFNEVADDELRERLIRLFMQHQVLPELIAGPAGCSAGYNLHWTFGIHRLRS